jgi:hypothetical protein
VRFVTLGGARSFNRCARALATFAPATGLAVCVLGGPMGQPLMRLMSTLARLVMSVGKLRLVATLPALAANSLFTGVLAVTALGATVGTAGCTRRAFATRAAATATTATSATTTATRLAITVATLTVPITTLTVGTAVCTLRVLTFSTRRERRARVDAVSDVVRDAVRLTRAIHVAATVRIT